MIIPYRVVAMPTEIAETTRTSLRSPRYGFPVSAELATGYGPCRVCLQFFHQQVDHRLLLTYDAFHGREDLPQPGPVYIHRDPCTRYPEDAGFPTALASHPLTFNGYADGRQLLAQVAVLDGKPEPVIQQLLTIPNLAYIQVHDRGAGCYDFRIERT